MGIEKIKKVVRVKIEKGDIDEAIQYIEQSGISLSKEQRNQLVLIKSNYANLIKQSITMTVSEEDERVIKQRILKSLLKFFDDDDIGENDSRNVQDILKELFPYILISLVIGVLFAIIMFLIKL